jgi:predicted HicB family RNase H-like nuclease
MGRKPTENIKVYSNLVVRLDPELREDTKQAAAIAGLSMNQYVADGLEHYNSLQRARRAKQEKQDQLELVGSK